MRQCKADMQMERPRRPWEVNAQMREENFSAAGPKYNVQFGQKTN